MAFENFLSEIGIDGVLGVNHLFMVLLDFSDTEVSFRLLPPSVAPGVSHTAVNGIKSIQCATF